MKIAMISSGFFPVIDGISVAVFNRLQKLSQYGHQVLLFCPDYSSLAEIYPNWKNYTGNIMPGVTVINLPSTASIGLNFERDVTVKSYKIVVQELEKFQPDIIHVDEPERLATRFFKIPGVRFAQRAGIPCVSFFHTNYIEYIDDYFPLPVPINSRLKTLFKRLFSWIYNAYNLTLVASSVTHLKISQMGIKNAVHHNLLGVDLDKFTPQLREERFFEKYYAVSDVGQKVKLVFLGRLTPDKGWHFTLNAFAKLAQLEIALIVAGDGPMREEIATRFGQRSLHLLGRISPDRVPALLANSDIHVTTSEKETTGLTILEAFAAGIPVLAPRAGGVMEHIRDGWNGCLYSPQDQDDFIEKLQLLVERETWRQAMGANAREYVMQYSWERTVNNLLEIWEAEVNKLKL